MKRSERSRDPEPLPLHAEASAESVAMLRIGVFALCAAEAWVLSGQALDVPAAAFSAFGFLTVLPPDLVAWMRSATGLDVMCWTAMLCAVAASVGFMPRISMPLATVGLIVTQAIPRAMQGFINHAQVPLMLCALTLCLGPATDALSLWPRRRTSEPARDYQSTLVIMLALICLGYTFIASHRIAYGGWELFSSDSLTQWFVRRNLGAREPETEVGMMVARTPALAAMAKASFPLVTLLELSAPLCLLFRRFRLFFVPAMLSVHLGIYLLMHISFSQLALLYILFIDSRHWSPRRLALSETGTVFFDGYCGLCNRFVDFLLARDRGHRLRFAPLDGVSAAALPAYLASVDSVVYAEGSRVFDRSTAAIAAIARLGGAWSFVATLGLVPRPVRDVVYDWVARNRYGWFGRRDQCRLPTAEERERFLT